jgi:hypothetical protein
MAQKIVLLNGPPRVGKNTAANILRMASNENSLVLGFLHHLKRMCHAIYLGEKGWFLDPDYFDVVKGEPFEYLAGKSWRQIYIHYSEVVIKPLHGDGWFGDRFIDAVRESTAQSIYVPDSGFRGESERVVAAFGSDNVRLIRLHRHGCTYEGDSRSHIDLRDLGVACSDVINVEGDPAPMRHGLLRALHGWVL